jgi:arsenate reductase
MEKLRVMFLCTGNSCRSQMAEGWAKYLAGDLLEVKSAGIKVTGQNQRAIQTMADVGIDISMQQSIRVNGEMLEWTDLLVTLCDNAEAQCPIVNPQTLRLHMPIADPAKLKGPEQEVMAEFAIIRDKIRERVEVVIQQLKHVA